MRDLSFLLALLALIPIALRFPQVGVLLWVWTAVLAPNDLFYGFLAAVPLGKAVVGLTMVVLVFSQQKKYYRFDTSYVVMTLFLLSATVSAFNSIGDDALNWDLYSKLFKILLLAYVVSVTMGTRIRIHALIAAVCLGLGFHGFTQGLMYIASGGGHKILGIPSVGDNNSFAVAILMVIPLMLYLAMYSADRIIKFSWFVGLTVSVISVVATFSRGGFIGMAMLGFGLVATSKRKAASLLMLAVAAVAIYAFAPAAWFARVDTIDSATSDDSFMGRVIAWKISTLVALARPFFGGGFHAIQSLPVWQAYQANFASLDFIPTSLPDVSPHAAHSIYFEVLGDLGFVGLFLFLSLLLLSFRNVQVIRKLSKGKPELAWAYDLANALRLSMIVYCVSAAALSMAYLELLYILLAATSRLRSMVEVELGLRDEKGRKLSGLALPIRPIEYGRPGSAALGHARLPRHPI